MTVVIVGGKSRDTEMDRNCVKGLVEACAKAYPNCIFATSVSNKAVGKFVKEACLEKGSNDKFKYQLVTIETAVFSTQLSRSEYSSFFLARNAALLELGDIFYYFADDSRRGTMEDLIERCKANNRPYKVFEPDDTISLI